MNRLKRSLAVTIPLFLLFVLSSIASTFTYDGVNNSNNAFITAYHFRMTNYSEGENFGCVSVGGAQCSVNPGGSFGNLAWLPYFDGINPTYNAGHPGLCFNGASGLRIESDWNKLHLGTPWEYNMSFDFSTFMKTVKQFTWYHSQVGYLLGGTLYNHGMFFPNGTITFNLYADNTISGQSELLYSQTNSGGTTSAFEISTDLTANIYFDRLRLNVEGNRGAYANLVLTLDGGNCYNAPDTGYTGMGGLSMEVSSDFNYMPNITSYVCNYVDEELHDVKCEMSAEDPENDTIFYGIDCGQNQDLNKLGDLYPKSHNDTVLSFMTRNVLFAGDYGQYVGAYDFNTTRIDYINSLGFRFNNSYANESNKPDTNALNIVLKGGGYKTEVSQQQQQFQQLTNNTWGFFKWGIVGSVLNSFANLVVKSRTPISGAVNLLSVESGLNFNERIERSFYSYSNLYLKNNSEMFIDYSQSALRLNTSVLAIRVVRNGTTHTVYWSNDKSRATWNLVGSYQILSSIGIYAYIDYANPSSTTLTVGDVFGNDFKTAEVDFNVTLGVGDDFNPYIQVLRYYVTNGSEGYLLRHLYGYDYTPTYGEQNFTYCDYKDLGKYSVKFYATDLFHGLDDYSNRKSLMFNYNPSYNALNYSSPKGNEVIDALLGGDVVLKKKIQSGVMLGILLIILGVFWYWFKNDVDVTAGKIGLLLFLTAVFSLPLIYIGLLPKYLLIIYALVGAVFLAKIFDVWGGGGDKQNG